MVVAEKANSRSPARLKVTASGIFHLNRYAVISLVFYQEDSATLQPTVTRVFHLSQPAIEQTFAAVVIHLNTNDFAPMFFHMNYLRLLA
jgi:hypothetical protein